MHRRTLTLYISAVAVIIAILVAERLPVPYVILGPGPTLNTLGKDQSGKPLITITGHPVYPTSGHLNMVSITYQGGPGHQFNVFTALRAWLNPHEAVVPQSEIFAPGQSQQQVTAAGPGADDQLAAERHRGRAAPAGHRLQDRGPGGHRRDRACPPTASSSPET